MKTIQKGFIAPLLLALIAILLIGGGAYVYVQKNQTSQPSASQTADWKTYTNKEYGFSLRYPTDWTINDQSYTYQGEQNRSVNILSPIRVPDNVRFSIGMYFKDGKKTVTYSGLIKAKISGDQAVTRVYLNDRDLEAAYPTDFTAAQKIIDSAVLVY